MKKFIAKVEAWVAVNNDKAAIAIVVLAVGWAAAGLSFFLCILS